MEATGSHGTDVLLEPRQGPLLLVGVAARRDARDVAGLAHPEGRVEQQVGLPVLEGAAVGVENTTCILAPRWSERLAGSSTGSRPADVADAACGGRDRDGGWAGTAGPDADAAESRPPAADASPPPARPAEPRRAPCRGWRQRRPGSGRPRRGSRRAPSLASRPIRLRTQPWRGKGAQRTCSIGGSADGGGLPGRTGGSGAFPPGRVGGHGAVYIYIGESTNGQPTRAQHGHPTRAFCRAQTRYAYSTSRSYYARRLGVRGLNLGLLIYFLYFTTLDTH